MQYNSFPLRLLFFSTAFIALLLATVFHEASSHLSKTKRWLDLAIAGDGFFALYDQETGESRYTRLGSFDIDEDGQLAIFCYGKTLPLEPPVSVPQDSTDLVVSTNGEVSVKRNGIRDRIGWILLNRLTIEENVKEPREIDSSNLTSLGMISTLPGESGCGYLLQGWIENRIHLAPILYVIWGFMICCVCVATAPKIYELVFRKRLLSKHSGTMA